MKIKNLLLTSALAFFLLGFIQQSNAQDIKSDLVAYYPLDGNAASGLEGGTEGELVGAVVSGEGILGKTDGALQLTVYGDGITMSDENIDLPIEDQVRSMSAWYKPDANLEVAYLISYGTPSDEEKGAHMHFAYRRNDGVIRIGHWYADYDFEVDDLADGDWHHFAFTYDQNTFVCYLDGEIIGEQDVNSDLAEVWTIPNGQLGLGVRNHPDLNDPAIGFLDEIRIYKRVLTEEEIVKIYELDPDDKSSVKEMYKNDISLSPNPAANFFTINTSEVVTKVQVVDFSGRTVLHSTNKTIDISGLTSGIYMVNVETAKGTSVSKLIKE